ncbi:hypothetical protein C8R43DRAFT_975072 [Mycena crocata]|nr:hypothetical protein C8R43DRAFT_975072 [Mycena crocata]
MSVAQLSALPVNDDIVDRILTFCPTFTTLQSTILVSKDFYRVFQTHPKSITHAVAYNIVGPPLPQALRAIRYPYSHLQNDKGGSSSSDSGSNASAGEDKDQDGSMDPIAMATACPESDDASVLTTEEKHELQNLNRTVTRLEDIYSLRCKNRTSKTSLLTPAESWRFRRAAYRIMLYCKIFSVAQYHDDEIEDLEDLDPDTCEKIYEQRAAVLNQYPTDELFEIFTVAGFMRGIFADVDDDEPNILEMVLSTGPAGAVCVWVDRSFSALDDVLPQGFRERDDAGEEIPLFAGFFSRAFETIWAARNVKPPLQDPGSSRHILDSVTGANDVCSQCATPSGLKLLSQTNWSRLQIGPHVLLKNKLRHNRSLKDAFAHVWWQITRNIDDLGVWIEGLFALRAAANPADSTSADGAESISDGGAIAAGTSTSPSPASTSALEPATLAIVSDTSFARFTGWKMDLSYCEPCLRSFLEEHAWVWWLERELKSGWTPPEDCWYGYNCNTQTHKATHAQQKNHLCVPTRGTA